MNINGRILVSENKLDELNTDVSLVLTNNDPIDENIYITENPNFIGVFISKNDIDLLDRVLNIIKDYEPELETQDIQSSFVPDKELLELASMHPCNAPLPLIGIDKNNKEEV